MAGECSCGRRRKQIVIKIGSRFVALDVRNVKRTKEKGA